MMETINNNVDPFTNGCIYALEAVIKVIDKSNYDKETLRIKIIELVNELKQ